MLSGFRSYGLLKSFSHVLFDTDGARDDLEQIHDGLEAAVQHRVAEVGERASRAGLDITHAILCEGGTALDPMGLCDGQSKAAGRTEAAVQPLVAS